MAEPCVAANPAIARWLKSMPPAGRVADLGSFRSVAYHQVIRFLGCFEERPIDEDRVTPVTPSHGRSYRSPANTAPLPQQMGNCFANSSFLDACHLRKVSRDLTQPRATTRTRNFSPSGFRGTGVPVLAGKCGFTSSHIHRIDRVQCRSLFAA